MFGKRDEPKLETIIGPETLLQGEIRSKGAVRIDGKFEGGVIEGYSVIVGDAGTVNGDIVAQQVVIGGKVTGSITAGKSIEIQAKAHLYGDIQTHRLSIAEGAIYEGHCTMTAEVEENAQLKGKAIR